MCTGGQSPCAHSSLDFQRYGENFVPLYREKENHQPLRLRLSESRIKLACYAERKQSEQSSTINH